MYVRDRRDPSRSILVPGNYGGNAFPRETQRRTEAVLPRESGKGIIEKEENATVPRASLSVEPIRVPSARVPVEQSLAVPKTEQSAATGGTESGRNLLPPPLPAEVVPEEGHSEATAKPDSPACREAKEPTGKVFGFGSEELLLLGLILLLTMDGAEEGAGLSETPLYLLLLLFLH